MKKANRIFTVLIFIFLYIPMAVLIIGSFNTGKSLSVFEGFTFNQYLELFRDQDLLALLAIPCSSPFCPPLWLPPSAHSPQWVSTP